MRCRIVKFYDFVAEIILRVNWSIMDARNSRDYDPFSRRGARQENTVLHASRPVFIYVIQVAQINTSSFSRPNAACANKRLYY